MQFRTANGGKIIIEDKFKYCRVHENKAVWDLPRSCSPIIEIPVSDPSLFHILTKRTNLINGKGWKCSVKIIEYQVWTNIFYKKFHELNPRVTFEDLSSDDCIEMLRTRKCNRRRMICDNNYYSSNLNLDPEKFTYSWMQLTVNKFRSCEMYEVNILSESADHKIVTNERTLSQCLSKDCYCKLQDSIIIWEHKIVHECPFELVKSIVLTSYQKALINTKENKYFEVVENLTICNGLLSWKTNNGFYLTKDNYALKLKEAPNEIKIIDTLMLSEFDFKTANLMTAIATITRQTNEKICQVYKTFVSMFKKMDDEFFIFNDFNGNEAVLYSDRGQIFVPNCVEVNRVVVVEKTDKCYTDFPSIITLNNQTITVFLTNDLILRQTGKLINCNNHFHDMYLPKINKILAKKGKNTFLEDEKKFVHLKFNLQENNMSLINFQHDERIVNSINLIRETANVTTIHEPMGAWHILNDMRSHLQEFERNSGEFSYLPGSNKLSLMDKILGFFAICISILLFILIFKISLTVCCKYQLNKTSYKQEPIRDLMSDRNLILRNF